MDEQEQLLKLAKEGDSVALEKLASQYKMLIRALCNRFFLVGGDKDDLLQECMIGLFNAVMCYDEKKGPFPAFAKLCILQHVLNAVRRDGGKGNLPLRDYVLLDDQLFLIDYNGDPEEALLQKERCRRLKEALTNSLTPTERRVLELYVEGNSYKSIMQQTGKSRKSVDGALQRAREKVMEHTNR